MKAIIQAFVILLAIFQLSVNAAISSYSFLGNLSHANEIQLFSAQLLTQNTITMTTRSYSGG